MARRKREIEENKPMEPPLTPMIDVIFQLLIFFMLTIQFKELEGEFLSHLPTDKGLQHIFTPPKDIEEVAITLVGKKFEKTDITIGLARENRKFMGTLLRSVVPDLVRGFGRWKHDKNIRRKNWEIIDKISQEVKRRINDIQNRRPEQEEIPVKLYCKGDLPYEHVMDSITACRKIDMVIHGKRVRGINVEFVFSEKLNELIKRIRRDGECPMVQGPRAR
jgi:hypothetical protein